MITFTTSFDKSKSRNAEKCCRNADFHTKIKATQAVLSCFYYMFNIIVAIKSCLLSS